MEPFEPRVNFTGPLTYETARLAPRPPLTLARGFAFLRASIFLAIFGGARPVMAHLIQTGQLTMDDIQDAERVLRESEKENP